MNSLTLREGEGEGGRAPGVPVRVGAVRVLHRVRLPVHHEVERAPTVVPVLRAREPEAQQVLLNATAYPRAVGCVNPRPIKARTHRSRRRAPRRFR